jgi:hypothetical protein
LGSSLQASIGSLVELAVVYIEYLPERLDVIVWYNMSSLPVEALNFVAIMACALTEPPEMAFVAEAGMEA